MIERTHTKLSVGAQCRLLPISRSSFYYAPQGEAAMNFDLMLLVGYLLGGLRIDKPNQVWCADITYLPMRHYFPYLVAIMERFPRDGASGQRVICIECA